MSRSHEDGRRGGGHGKRPGREYQSRRLPGYPPAVKYCKRLTHRLERREGKRSEVEPEALWVETPEEQRHRENIEALTEMAWTTVTRRGSRC